MLYKQEIKAGRRQVLSGTEFSRGDVVPGSVLSTIPPNRLASMKRVGLLLESYDEVSEAVPDEAVVFETPEEGLCPQCGEGPFSRLARHVAAKHESIEELANGVN